MNQGKWPLHLSKASFRCRKCVPQPKLLLTLGCKWQCNDGLLPGIKLFLRTKSDQSYGTIVKHENVHLNQCEIANPPELLLPTNADSASVILRWSLIPGAGPG